MNRFQNKKIIVTGAATGIGRATALRIAQEGGDLGLIDINIAALKTVAKELSQFNIDIS